MIDFVRMLLNKGGVTDWVIDSGVRYFDKEVNNFTQVTMEINFEPMPRGNLSQKVLLFRPTVDWKKREGGFHRLQLSENFILDQDHTHH